MQRVFSSFGLKEVIGKILLVFCVTAGTSWFAVPCTPTGGLGKRIQYLKTSKPV